MLLLLPLPREGQRRCALPTSGFVIPARHMEVQANLLWIPILQRAKSKCCEHRQTKTCVIQHEKPRECQRGGNVWTALCWITCWLWTRQQCRLREQNKWVFPHTQGQQKQHFIQVIRAAARRQREHPHNQAQTVFITEEIHALPL